MKRFWESKTLAVLLLVASVGFFVYSIFLFNVYQAEAGAGDNTSGWVWSANTGWISFNCINAELPNPLCNGYNYGVNIDGAGLFSGYSWSENIGAVSFNSASLANCPQGSCVAKVDLLTGEVSGWARACSVFVVGCAGVLAPNDQRGGWEGWIKLRGIETSGGTAYGVYVDSTVPSNPVLRGWAWGGSKNDNDNAIIGWISFSDQSFDPDDDDKVDVPPETPPGGPPEDDPISDYGPIPPDIFNNQPDAPAILPENFSKCGGSPQIALRTGLTLNWDYSDSDGDLQQAYQIQVDSENSFANARYDHIEISGAPSDALRLALDDAPLPNITGDWLPSLSWSTTYYWRVKVQDKIGRASCRARG